MDGMTSSLLVKVLEQKVEAIKYVIIWVVMEKKNADMNSNITYACSFLLSSYTFLGSEYFPLLRQARESSDECVAEFTLS